MINYGRQSVGDDDVRAVVDALESDFLTQGPWIEAFEASVASYVGARFAIAYSSGTAALHGAMWSAGLGAGDLVVTSPLTFMASANAIRYVGATPGLVDIEEATWNIDMDRIPDGAKAVVPVHYAGLPVDLDSSSRSTPVIIEDAAHALGAMTPYGPVGNCARSDMCCFSFHPVKPVTTGEGGIVTTNDPEYAERLKRFRSHGIIRRPELGGWYYEISDVAFNYRMTDLQAALGVSQMKKLEQFISRRNEIAERYRVLLHGSAVGLPPAATAGFRHGYHLFPVWVNDRRRVFDGLRESGFGVQVHYVPVHHHPVSVDCVLPKNGLPVCERVYEGLISLPIYPGLPDDDQTRVVETLLRLV